MSGNTERRESCPICKRVPMYFEIHTRQGLLGWIHDKLLTHDGQRYRVEIAAIFIKKHGRHFDLSRLGVKEVRCKDCGKLSNEYTDILWERFKEMAANGLLLIPPEGGW